MKIVLMGYMGSGKSTIGKVLSLKKKTPFIDLDAYIEEKENLSIPEIFSSKGEIYFRKQESYYLEQVLTSNDNFVLSLGGGTPCYGRNLEFIKASTAYSIYLKASIPTIFNRVRNSQEKRPLLDNFSDEKLTDYIGKHLFERAPYYEQADRVVLINGLGIPEIVSQIESLLI